MKKKMRTKSSTNDCSHDRGDGKDSQKRRRKRNQTSPKPIRGNFDWAFHTHDGTFDIELGLGYRS